MDASDTMEVPTARTLSHAADEAAAISTIVAAFIADPMARWTWPSAHQYLAAMPRMVKAVGGNAFAHDGAYGTDQHRGVALWLVPGVHPDKATLDEILESTVAPLLRDDSQRIFAQMATFHPEEPHWYLPFIGVDPAHQGKGHGDVLMAYALQFCDRDHLPAYLESTNPHNISLYQRHGFEALGTIQAGSSPPLVPMLRVAR